ATWPKTGHNNRHPYLTGTRRYRPPTPAQTLHQHRLQLPDQIVDQLVQGSGPAPIFAFPHPATTASRTWNDPDARSVPILPPHHRTTLPRLDRYPVRCQTQTTITTPMRNRRPTPSL